MGYPYRQIGYWHSYVTTQTQWTQDEKLVELECGSSSTARQWYKMLTTVVTPQDVEAFGKEILSRLHVETLVHGNTSPTGAKEIQDMVEKILNARALAEGEKENPRALVLPPCKLHLCSDPPN